MLVFVGEGMDVTQVEVLGTDITRVASDHLPLIVDLRFTGSPVKIPRSRLSDGDCLKNNNEQACCADLVVVSRAGDRRVMSGDDPVDEYVVLRSPSPVLVLPNSGLQATSGKNIVVGWNNNRHSTHAVQGVMPYLQLLEKVDVIAVNPRSGDGDIPTADICQHLARHGVKAEGSQTVAKDFDSGTALLSRGMDLGSDLIVMGAYGHTRFR